MIGDRHRFPITSAYRGALGYAVICFARCEWAAVYCCDALQPGYVATVKPKRKTAGRIALDLVQLFSQIGDVALKAQAEPLAQQFKALTMRRNDLLHGKPMTGPKKQQRLSDNVGSWSIADINAIADQFAECGIALNTLYHNELN